MVDEERCEASIFVNAHCVCDGVRDANKNDMWELVVYALGRISVWCVHCACASSDDVRASAALFSYYYTFLMIFVYKVFSELLKINIIAICKFECCTKSDKRYIDI